MSSSVPTDSRTQILLEEVIRLFAQGLSLEHVAQKANMDPETVRRLMVHEAFEATFEALAPSAFKAWKSSQADSVESRQVRQMALEDAPYQYRKLRELADSGNLNPSDERAVRTDLIKLAGVLKDDTVTETVKLSPGQLEWLEATDREVDELFDQFNTNRR